MYSCLLIGRRPAVNITRVRILLIILAVVLSPVTLAAAEDWTTTDGTKYVNVRVIRVEDDAITIIYRDGGALVPLFKLPPALQQKFDYDPVKAKAAAEARSKADTENAAALQHEIEVANELRRKKQIQDAQAMNETNAPSK